MIDTANYRRAIAWLERNQAEYQANPNSTLLAEGLLHSFKVTYNVTETNLRQALGEITGDQSTSPLSSPELLRYAGDEGLTLCDPVLWLGYGIDLERATERCGESFHDDLFRLLPRYLTELKAFAGQLEGRLVPVA